MKACKAVFEKVPARLYKGVKEAADKLSLHYVNLKEREKDLFSAPRDYKGVTVPVDHAVLITNPTNIYAKEPVVFSELIGLMKGSKERVFIQTPYAVLGKDMYRAMEEAVKEQPDLTLLLNSRAVGDNFMASSDYTINRKKILKTGLNLYEYFGSHSIHGKSIVIDDDISVVMTYNLDMRSTYIDTEMAYVIRGKKFNQLLDTNMQNVKDEALPVHKDESYAKSSAVKEKELPKTKEMIFAVTSVIFQLFRFLF